MRPPGRQPGWALRFFLIGASHPSPRGVGGWHVRHAVGQSMLLRFSRDAVPLGRPAWSFTRHTSLAACARLVYWTYYGSRGLGLSHDDPIAARAFALRWRTSLPEVVRQATHNAARALIDSIRDERVRPPVGDLLRGAHFTLDHVVRASASDRLEHFWAMPAIHPALRHALHRTGPTSAELADAKQHLSQCIERLAAAPVLNDVADAWCRGRNTGVVSGFAGPDLFTLGENIIWIAMDVAYVHFDPGAHRHLVRRPTWCVADIRTERLDHDPAAERLRLAVYALYLGQLGYPAFDGTYLGRIVDLYRGVDRWYRLDASALLTAQAAIATDMHRQKQFMADPDQGEPHPPAHWPLATDIHHCRSCNFLDLCRHELIQLSGRHRDPEL